MGLDSLLPLTPRHTSAGGHLPDHWWGNMRWASEAMAERCQCLLACLWPNSLLHWLERCPGQLELNLQLLFISYFNLRHWSLISFFITGLATSFVKIVPIKISPTASALIPDSFFPQDCYGKLYKAGMKGMIRKSFTGFEFTHEKVWIIDGKEVHLSTGACS